MLPGCRKTMSTSKSRPGESHGLRRIMTVAASLGVVTIIIKRGTPAPCCHGLECLLMGWQIRLDRFYVFRCRTFGPLHNIETDALTFGQRLEASCLNGAVMNEHIPAVILFDEPEALLLIEPLHF